MTAARGLISLLDADYEGNCQLWSLVGLYAAYFEVNGLHHLKKVLAVCEQLCDINCASVKHTFTVHYSLNLYIYLPTYYLTKLSNSSVSLAKSFSIFVNERNLFWFQLPILSIDV